MTDQKHTPGPWVLGKPGRNAEDEHMCEVMTAYANGSDAKSYDLICECRKGSSVRIPVAEKIANARLIAAAPEMLEALREAEKELRGLYKAIAPHGDFASRSEGISGIVAAIAKAEGR